MLRLLYTRTTKPSPRQRPAQRTQFPRRAHQLRLQQTRLIVLPSLRHRRRQNSRQLDHHVQVIDKLAAVLHHRRQQQLQQHDNSQAYRLWRIFPLDTGTAAGYAVLCNLLSWTDVRSCRGQFGVEERSRSSECLQCWLETGRASGHGHRNSVPVALL